MEDFLKDIIPLVEKEEQNRCIPSKIDMIWNSLYNVDLYNGDFKEKLPRKLKKQILGTKINRSKLRNRSRKLVKKFIELDCNCIEMDINSDDDFLFCPKCGFKHMKTCYSSDGYDSQSHCIKCGAYLGGSDCSPWYSVFQEMELKDC